MAASAGSSGEKALHTAIQTRSFAPAYYLYGGDEYLKEDALQRLLAAAVDPATRDFNLELRRGAELDAETLGSMLAMPPMMAERRVVVVRDVSALRKDVRGVLERYLEKPASDTVLVLTSPAEATPDKMLVARTTAVELDPLTGARVPRWIAHYAGQLACEITPEAAALLQEAAGTELAQLRLELDKLASYVMGDQRTRIEEADVTAVVGIRRGETMGALLDAIGRRDAALALELVPIVLQQPKTSAVQVVMALTTQLLGVGWARAMRGKGVPFNRLFPEVMNGFLKTGGSVYTGRAWGEAVGAWLKQLDFWDSAAIDAGLDALLAAESALKETRLSSDEQLLANLVLTLCGATGARKKPRAA